MKAYRKQFLSTLFLAPLLTLVSMVPQSAWATGCVGARCESKDPGLMGCDKDALYIGLSGIVIPTPNPDDSEVLVGVLYHYYSPACDAQWAKVENAEIRSPYTRIDATLFDGSSSLFGYRSVTIRTGRLASMTSLMSNGSRTVEACANIYYTTGEVGHACTGTP